MLESLRESAKGPVTRGVLYVVIFAFIFSGGSMVFNSVVGNYVAKVNGEEIGAGELERSFQITKERFGEMFERIYDSEEKVTEFKRNLLQQLIQQKLLEQAVADLGIKISTQQLAEAVREIPQFQKDGKYDKETAEAVLRQVGYSKQQFQVEQLRAMADNQFRQGVLATAFALPNEAKFNFQKEKQERDIRYLTLSAKSFMDEIEITDEAIEDYYLNNPVRFETAEKVKVDYVSLKLDDVEKGVTVSDEEARKKYDESRDDYKRESRRKVAHILIEVDEEADGGKAAAEAKIKALKAKLDAGEDFGKLAKENSDDAVSAEDYGELDWFGRDEYDEAFETAAYNLEKVGDVSDVVESESGFHLIKLAGVEGETYLKFEEVKADIITALKAVKAQEKFKELKEIFDDKVLEIDDELAEIAETVETKVQTSDFLTRMGGPGIFSNPAVSQAAFSDEVLINEFNSETIKIDDWHYVVLRKNIYEPKKTRPLDEVKAQITQILKNEKASEKAQAKGKAVLEKLVAKEDITAEFGEKAPEWKEQKAMTRTGSGVDGAIRSKAFEISVAGDVAKAYDGVELANGDYALVQVQAIREGEFDKAEDAAKKQTKDRIARVSGQVELTSFVNWLKEKSDITINL